MPHALKFDLWLDESGTFQETSTDQDEQSEAQSQRFPSQLAGLLVPSGSLDQDHAAGMLGRAHVSAGLPYVNGQHVHACDIHDQTAYNLLVKATAESIAQKRDWFAVRIVNAERMVFGDRATTYTMMVAELMLRICEHLSRTHDGKIFLDVTCAEVVLEDSPDKGLVIIEEREYRASVTRELARAAISRGLSAEAQRWDYILKLGSGRKRPELQLCDIVSNGSKGDFERCNPSTKALLQRVFGPFDLTLTIRTLDNRIDELMDAGSLGQALQMIGDAANDAELTCKARAFANERLSCILERLARQPAATRDLHLAAMAPWLEQQIREQRDSSRGVASRPQRREPQTPVALPVSR